MPVSVKRSPFTAGICTDQPKPNTTTLRTPQARVLAALMPTYLDDPVSEWPLVTRTQLLIRAEYSPTSGIINRALGGIGKGSSSGHPHPGLLALGYVEEVPVNVDGLSEANYRATPAGIQAYRQYLVDNGGALPKHRAGELCTNNRYKKNSQEQEDIQ